MQRAIRMKGEDSLQATCVQWFDLQYKHLSRLLFAVPNGGSRNIMEAAKLKRTGVRAGVSDLVLAVPRKEYHGMFIELKYGKNKLTELQDVFLTEVRLQNYKGVVIRSFEEFKEIIESYLKGEE